MIQTDVIYTDSTGRPTLLVSLFVLHHMAVGQSGTVQPYRTSVSRSRQGNELSGLLNI